ncbi:DUF2314 domain-containing protein [Dactylosporangium siamense]|uniref:DUF2314 domain-containing protein n=1 Tax=Dactylosporangium siamense TaxID=685454 RepID=A0A919PHX5_9ACTN|nr:DUF2314 domain-containing protein [Dactylosporangium siamense]GIG42228.1 hypothetical protein Dsi01nite_002690 [Dactylosporangium siamense]
MDDAVTLSVPELVEATYVVATARPPADVQAAARDAAQRLPEPLRVGALRMLAGPLLSVTMSTVGDAPPLPMSFLGVFGASAAQLRDLEAATHVIVCQAVFRPGWPPAHEWYARGVAAGLAEETGGTLIDMFTPQILEPAAALRSLPDPDGRIVLVRWVLVPQSAGDRGLWMTTKGLGRFGLPELQVLAVPPALAGAWTRVMSGVAAALVRAWTRALQGEPSFAALPSRLVVGTADVARAYGHEPGPEHQAEVRLRLDPPDRFDGQAFLTVVPPDTYRWSAGEFLTSVSAALFGEPGSAVRRAPRDARMDAAIATARAALPQARARFLDRTITAPGQLIVKHGLAGHATQREYVWSTVTDWPDPERIHGVSMSDAETDPTVRAGRPTSVDAATVVDWGIWVDGRGIIEGGWTNQLLS